MMGGTDDVQEGMLMKVGVVLMPRGARTAEGLEPAVPFAQHRALARGIEEAGFDSLWVYDHLLERFPPTPTDGDWEAWTMLAAHAATTTRVEIGTLVTAIPFRNPGLLSKMAITVDEISGGRLILGLGAGWHKPEFDAFGYPFGAKVDRFEEALQIIRPLLREGRATFDGRFYSADDAELVPRGPRPDAIPIMIAAFGPRMLRMTARFADIWNTAWYGSVDGYLKAVGEMREACEAEGRDPATLVHTAGLMVTHPDGPPESEKGLSGSPEEVAVGLRAFDEAGAALAICRLNVMNERSLDFLSRVLDLYRGGVR
jgi:probable F420-dependent oxidoreductase